MMFWLRVSKTALLDRVWHTSMMRKDDCTLAGGGKKGSCTCGSQVFNIFLPSMCKRKHTGMCKHVSAATGLLVAVGVVE